MLRHNNDTIRETKSTLARLLASENLRVEHRADIETAMFNPKTRLLLLPMFENMSGALYDLLVGHEVGHALFTPEDGFHHKDCKQGPNFRSILNVTEDARIEKRVKRKFPGLRKDFVEGYTDLIDRDFFGIKDRDLSTLNLIDKINIRTKTGGLVDVPFDDDEKVFLDRAFGLETFDEAVALANDLYDHCSDAADTDHGHGEPGTDGDEGEWVEVDPEDISDDTETITSNEPSEPREGDDVNPEDGNPSDDGDDGEGSDEGSSSSDEEGDDEGEEESESGGSSETDEGEGGDDSPESEDDDESSNGNTPTDGAGGKDEDDTEIDSENPFSETDKNFRDREKELVNEHAGDIHYVTTPKDVHLDRIIRPFKQVHKELSDGQVKYLDRKGWDGSRLSDGLNAFLKSAKKTVSYLAKEFEMKKAADEYARASTSRTGVVDVNKLHSYKYNEDLFKRTTVVPSGKSHGLVMFIDLSGSMSENIGSTIEQLMCLTLFCKKVNIPFDVYGFNDNRHQGNAMKDAEGNILPYADYKHGELTLNETFYLRHYFSSEMRASEFKVALSNMWFMKFIYDYGDYYSHALPAEDMLGSTPLNDTIIIANQIVDLFREKTRVQVVNVVFLTDGESNGLGNFSDGNGGVVRTRYNGNIVLTDERTHKSHPLTGWTNQTDTLLNVLKSNAGVNIAGFFLINKRRGKRELNSFFYSSSDHVDVDVEFAKFKKDGVLVVTNRGYDEYYIIPGGSDLSAVDSDDPLEGLSVDASKQKIKSAFGKSTGGKVKNKVVLTKFIDLITS